MMNPAELAEEHPARDHKTMSVHQSNGTRMVFSHSVADQHEDFWRSILQTTIRLWQDRYEGGF